MNQKHINELFEIIADGSLDAEDIAAMSDEVLKAHADAAAYLLDDAESQYQQSYPLPLWEWVLLEQLEGGLIFHAPHIDALYAQIVDAFGDDELDLAVADLAGLDAAAALAKVQDELAPTYSVVDFSKSVAGEKQVVLVRTAKLARFLELSAALGLQASA
ncbi:hypothetical protein [Chitinibacter sp. GC72]|uniref:hypothetical protein n=1 Tax=Chitinibacter sp. GC72 TaxID=1526917 RepID=UPI0012FB414C|nr:hypothetical protein [Chitinibacter sp. GC72]